MPTVADLRIEIPLFERAFEAHPELTVRFEGLHHVEASRQAAFYLWFVGVAPDVVTELLEADPDVSDVRVVITEDGTSLVRLTVSPSSTYAKLYEAFAANDATVIDATVDGTVLACQVRVPRHETLRAIETRVAELGASCSLVRVHTELGPTDVSDSPLSEKQHEALLAALEAGYFGTPRESTLADIAADLGISPQALSERLRRGHAALLESVLTEDDDA